MNEKLEDVRARLWAWQRNMFPERRGQTLVEDLRLGVIEEVGELAHALLKRRQGIRGMGADQVFADARDDAIGDILVYYIQLCTALDTKVSWLGDREQSHVTVPQALSTVTTSACADGPVGYFTLVIRCLAKAASMSCEEVLGHFFTTAERVMRRRQRTEVRDEEKAAG